MYLLNIIIIFFLSAFAWLGWRGGLVRALGALVGVGMGILAASQLYEPAAGFVGLLLFGHYGLAGALCFILIFVVTMRLSSFIFQKMDKWLNISERWPVLKKFNHLGGILFGLVQGAFILGMVLSVIIKYPWGIFLDDSIGRSSLASGLTAMGEYLSFLLPASIGYSETII